VHVAVAVIRNSSGQIFITLRPDHVHQGGLWEFPGGKLEPGEPVQHALRREIAEEIGIEVQDILPLIKISYQYPSKKVLLDVWEVLSFQGTAHGREGQAYRWVMPDDLHRYQFPEANRGIIAAARLPHRYLITPDPGSEVTQFLQQLEASLRAGIKLVQLRAKTLTPQRYRQLADAVTGLCHRYHAKVLVNADQDTLEQRLQLSTDGVHVTSACLLSLSTRPVTSEQWFAASCHDLLEINHANRLGADFVVLGSVKSTASHPVDSPLGWDKFSELVKHAEMPVYALGGMLEEEVPASRLYGGQGIAAIRGLWGK